MLRFPEVGVAKLTPLVSCSVVLSMMKLMLVVSIETAMWYQFYSERVAVVVTSALEVKGELKTSLSVDLTILSEA